jgi:hypothetical protein
LHQAIQLAGYWALAFLTLGIAVVLLNIFFGLTGYDLELRSVGSEAAIAATASFVEAGTMWLVMQFVPAAALRVAIIPGLVVAVIYKFSHLVDWSRYHIFMLLVFQAVIGCFGASLVLGHFQAAIAIAVVFSIVLAVIVGTARNL